MVATIGSINVSLTTNVGPYQAGLNKAQSVTAVASQKIRRDVGIAEGSVNSFYRTAGGRSNFRPYSLIAVSRAFDNVSDRAGLLRGSILATTAVFGGFAAALGSNVILRYADSFTNLTNQLRVVSDGSADLAARFEALEGVATRSRSSLEATAILYSRIQKAAPTRAADDVLRFTETIQKALVLGGSTAQEARSAAIQFSQAIASNRLGGEELRAILETPLGLELARGLDVTLGKFREMGHAGELTAGVVLGALDRISGRIDNQFSQSVRTLDQALIHVDNKLTSYIGSLNKAYGGTQLLGGAIVKLGDNLESIVPTLAHILGLLAAVSLARHKALTGGIAGGVGGALLGNELGGATGAILGGAVGGLLGFGAPGAFGSFREEAGRTKLEIRDLTDETAKLKAEFLAAGRARQQAIIGSKGDPIAAAAPSLQAGVRRTALAPGSTISDLRAAEAKAAADGQLRLSEAVSRTTGAYKLAGVAYRDATGQLTALTKAATAAGRAKMFLRTQLSSIVGLFGGPWGVAITGAIAGLSLLAFQAQKRAQQIANAEALIAQRITDLADAGDQQARTSVIDLRLKKLEEEKQAYEDLIALRQRQLRSAAGSALDGPTGLGAEIGLFLTGSTDARDRIIELQGALGDGSIKADKFVEAVTKIVEQNPRLAEMARIAIENAEAMERLAQATAAVSQEMEELRKPISVQLAPKGPFEDFLAQREKDTTEVIGGIDDEIEILRLEAQGNIAGAEAQKIINKAKADGKFIDMELVKSKVAVKVALEEEVNALKKTGKAADTLADKLARLKAESGAAFLNDLDRGVVEQARGLKVAASLIDQYIAAVKSGDLSKAPPTLVQLRDFALMDRAAESARGLIQEYGTWGQVSGLAAQKQQELTIAVQNGAITAEQAKVAFADYLGQFGQFRFIEEFSSAFGDLVKSGLDGWESLEQGALSFLKRIRDLIVELLVIEPLMKSLRGALGQGVQNGTGVGGFISRLLGGGFDVMGGTGIPNAFPGASMVPASVGVFHGGGVVGMASTSRTVNPGIFAHAPRYHSGLRAGERAGIFEMGEEILTREMQRRDASTVAGLASLAAGGNSGPEIHIHESPGTTTEVRKRPDGNLDIIVREVESRLSQSVASNGQLGRTIGGTFGLNRKPRGT